VGGWVGGWVDWWVGGWVGGWVGWLVGELMKPMQKRHMHLPPLTLEGTCRTVTASTRSSHRLVSAVRLESALRCGRVASPSSAWNLTESSLGQSASCRDLWVRGALGASALW